MGNVIYTTFLKKLADNDIDFSAAGTVVRCMLERSTSTYSVNKDHEFVGDLTNFVEIDVASYTPITVTTKAANHDTANDRVELTFDAVAFGPLESGQIVKALVFYVQTGGDDLTPADDSLICYIDTATGLPATLGGGDFQITPNAEGVIQIAQA